MGSAAEAISRIDTFSVECPLAVPVGPSVCTYDRRSALLVRMEDGDGHVGWGETYSSRSAFAALDALAAFAVGESCADRLRLVDVMATRSGDRMALSAMSIAIDDLRARQLGVPVAELYGGRRRDSVRAYASSGGYRDDAAIETTWPAELAAALDDGYRAAKFRIGRFAPSRELPLLRQLREAAGSDVDLMVDANGAYAVPTALRVGRALEEVAYRWFEEPLIRFANGLVYPGYEHLARLDIPIAAAEGLETRSDFDAFLTRGAAAIVQPDVAICGGIGEALFVADLAMLRGRQCIPHAWGGAVLIAATMQLLAVLRDPSEMPGVDSPILEVDRIDNPVRTEIGAGELRPVDGAVEIPDASGLGLTVDDAAVRRLAAATSSHTRTDH